jgi:hypothetical protein
MEKASIQHSLYEQTGIPHFPALAELRSAETAGETGLCRFVDEFLSQLKISLTEKTNEEVRIPNP